ncbi:hypothetical protein BC936DRAFT_147462 [Jimgerdemannia flammicorona]|uniref:Uncharacterized protein n=1 Tax=Jimgerdemannia flammicorona TaxID=994334 RepID=A0A433D580_9FUNG|nr:hypothetical protein BC936DRAFT_147462 [Jimgerdemannia flammicorona]
MYKSNTHDTGDGKKLGLQVGRMNIDGVGTSPRLLQISRLSLSLGQTLNPQPPNHPHHVRHQDPRRWLPLRRPPIQSDPLHGEPTWLHALPLRDVQEVDGRLLRDVRPHNPRPASLDDRPPAQAIIKLCQSQARILPRLRIPSHWEFVDNPKQTISVTVGSLDDVDAVKGGSHIYCESVASVAKEVDRDLPKYRGGEW